MKKVLVFSDEFPPDIGGAGSVAKDYAEILNKNGFEVHVLSKYNHNRSFSYSYSIIQCRLGLLPWFFKYYTRVNFHDYDIILLNDVRAAITAGFFFDKSLLQRSIAVLHGSEPEKIYLFPTTLRKLLGFARKHRRVMSHCRQIVCVSNYMKNKFLESTDLHHFSSKISVIHNFINKDLFYRQVDSSFKDTLLIQNDHFILLTISRLDQKKGFDNMLSLFCDLCQHSKKYYTWIIVGDGPYFGEFSKAVDASGFSDDIKLLGSMPRSELAYYYSNSDLFWLLSDYNESLGLVYIEAQACGCPVLGRNTAGVKETIVDNITGYLVSSNMNIIKIIEDHTKSSFLYSDLVENARKFSSDYFLTFIRDNIFI